MTTILTSIETLREYVANVLTKNQTIGFVPTMGNLHRGHLSLVERAQAECDVVIVSIFVNPMQFGPNEDFSRYPRTFDADYQVLTAQKTDAVFLPKVEMLYPRGLEHHAFIEVPGLSDDLCGASRPGHFRGVCTIVFKLLQLVSPDVVFLGEKDFQQLTLIRQMVEDLYLPVRVEGVATVRDAETGLALSSRNQYLTVEERSKPLLYPILCHARDRILAGERNYDQIIKESLEKFHKAGLKPDYFEIRRQKDLRPAGIDDQALVILTAVQVGKARLIDNVKATF